jgi:hypothetical protein
VTSAFRSDDTNPQRVTSTKVQNAAYFSVSDRGFIGETEVSSQLVLSELSVGDSRGYFVVGEDLSV